MKEVIIIGTIHLNWTPKEELIAEIKKYNPSQVFIELTDKEVEGGRENSIRDEMFSVLEWVRDQGIPYILFDTDLDTLKPGVTGKEREFLDYELKVKGMLKGHNWKSLNNISPWKVKEVDDLEEFLINKFYDRKRMEERNSILEENIKSSLIDGTNMVVTGAGHLSDLLKSLPNSKAPLRQD